MSEIFENSALSVADLEAIRLLNKAVPGFGALVSTRTELGDLPFGEWLNAHLPTRSEKENFGGGSGTYGTVAQATSNSTGVTINETNGVISMFAAVAAISSEEFTITNSEVSATSLIWLTVEGTTAAQVAPSVSVHTLSSGSFKICVTNHDGTNATSSALKIHFKIENP